MGFEGLDPGAMRANAGIADRLVEGAGDTRSLVVDVMASGELGGWPVTALDEIVEEVALLATLCREKATAMELASMGLHFGSMGDTTLGRLEASLEDSDGDDGMSTAVAIELLQLPSPDMLPDGWTPSELAEIAVDGTPRLGVFESLLAALTGAQNPPYDQESMPAWARDAVNRLLLDRDLTALEAKEDDGTLSDMEQRELDSIRAIQGEIALFESQVDPLDPTATIAVQLYIYAPEAFGGDGRAAISIGNIDTADNVAVMVPGMGTTVAGMGGDRAVNVYHESRWASDDGESVAIIDWVGYDAPSGGVGDDISGVLTRDMAREGAEQLSADVDVLLAARVRDPHLTVIGNSYGSTTAAIAADDFGLAADDLILTGSPGAGDAGDAKDLTTGREHTWVGSAARDFVTSLGVTGWTDPTEVLSWDLETFGVSVEMMGNDPSEDTFNAQRFQAENVDRGGDWNIDDHGRYYDPDTESLYNVAAIVVGEYDEVALAEHRYDPFYRGLRDPERGRDPTTPSHVDP